MKNLFSALLLFIIHMAYAQFPPAAGQPGTTAIYKDSSAFKAWATGCTITRGLQNIANPSVGEVTGGSISDAVGIANNKVVCLGDGGNAVLTFKTPIVNGPGYDFAVFENAFDNEFLELGFVEVSSDGTNFFRFPATSNTQDTVQTDGFGSTQATRINNLAGKYRMFYGTPFDLDELAGIAGLDIQNITHVKVVDVVGCIQSNYASHDKNGKKVNDPWPTEFISGGFDLDAVGVINQASPTSVSELFANIQLSVFPNPVTSSSFIQLNVNEPQTVTVDIIDLTGRQVAVVASKFQVQHSGNVSLENVSLKNGIYMLRVNTEHTSVTEKIVISNE